MFKVCLIYVLYIGVYEWGKVLCYFIWKVLFWFFMKREVVKKFFVLVVCLFRGKLIFFCVGKIDSLIVVF